MLHPILVRAEGESAKDLRNLIADVLPAGFEQARDIDPTRGLNVDPVSVALIAASGSVVASLISSLCTVWVTRIQQQGKATQHDKSVATVTVATHTDDIVIRIGTDPAAAIAQAKLPDDPAEILEIRLGVR